MILFAAIVNFCCLFFRHLFNDKQFFVDLDEEANNCHNFQNYDDNSNDDDNDGNHSPAHDVHHAKTFRYYDIDTKATNNMPARTILSVSEFVHKLFDLRQRQSRIASVRSGSELEHREEHVRLGFQKPVR